MRRYCVKVTAKIALEKAALQHLPPPQVHPSIFTSPTTSGFNNCLFVITYYFVTKKKKFRSIILRVLRVSVIADSLIQAMETTNAPSHFCQRIECALLLRAYRMIDSVSNVCQNDKVVSSK
jgi:hypothetical protein